MEKITIQYLSGESRYNGNESCDYMIGFFEDENGEEQELYAELPPDNEEECGTEEELWEEIVNQAREFGIAEDMLERE